jgi:SAM-dependent methyltransferase
MDLHQILDSIYIIPVLLEHLEKPTFTTTKVLRTNDITPQQIEECRKIKDLLLYHYKVIATGFQPNYIQLRQGLKQYYNEYLSGMFKRLDLVDKDYNVLDYGCGSGQVLKQFLRDNPLSAGIGVDKDPQVFTGFRQKDFEAEPDWYYDYLEYFNLVILSEVLHCKDLKTQQYLIASSDVMLKQKGILIIVENVDYCMEYRISKIKQDNFHVLNEFHIKELMEGTGFKMHNMITINRHNIYEFHKI